MVRAESQRTAIGGARWRLRIPCRHLSAKIPGVADGGDGGPGKGPLRPYILNSLMSEKILNFLVQFITHVIDLGGYGGVAALMGIESACIPLPSEIIMPFAGYLVYLGI